MCVCVPCHLISSYTRAWKQAFKSAFWVSFPCFPLSLVTLAKRASISSFALLKQTGGFRDGVK